MLNLKEIKIQLDTLSSQVSSNDKDELLEIHNQILQIETQLKIEQKEIDAVISAKYEADKTIDTDSLKVSKEIEALILELRWAKDYSFGKASKIKDKIKKAKDTKDLKKSGRTKAEFLAHLFRFEKLTTRADLFDLMQRNSMQGGALFNKVAELLPELPGKDYEKAKAFKNSKKQKTQELMGR